MPPGGKRGSIAVVFEECAEVDELPNWLPEWEAVVVAAAPLPPVVAAAEFMEDSNEAGTFASFVPVMVEVSTEVLVVDADAVSESTGEACQLGRSSIGIEHTAVVIVLPPQYQTRDVIVRALPWPCRRKCCK